MKDLLTKETLKNFGKPLAVNKVQDSIRNLCTLNKHFAHCHAFYQGLRFVNTYSVVADIFL